MIIGITGFACSGKDTVAKYIASEWGFATISFADPLKRICKDVFEFSNTQLWGPSEKRDEPDLRYKKVVREVYVGRGSERGTLTTHSHTEFLTPRIALQTLGSDWGRALYENVWVDYTLRISKKLLSHYGADYHPRYGIGFFPSSGSGVDPRYKGVVIPDCRFKNEIDAVRKEGGKVIRVTRKGNEKTVGIPGHPSEEEQKSVPDSELDAVIENDGTLEELYGKVSKVMERLLNEKNSVGTGN